MRYYETQSYTNDTMVIETESNRFVGNTRKWNHDWEGLEKRIATELKARQQTIATCQSCKHLIIIPCPAKAIGDCPECNESNWIIL